MPGSRYFVCVSWVNTRVSCYHFIIIILTVGISTLPVTLSPLSSLQIFCSIHLHVSHGRTLGVILQIPSPKSWLTDVDSALSLPTA